MGRFAGQRMVTLWLTVAILTSITHICPHHAPAETDLNSSEGSESFAKAGRVSHNPVSVDPPTHDEQLTCPCICHVPIVTTVAVDVESTSQILPTAIDSLDPPASPQRDLIDPPPRHS